MQLHSIQKHSIPVTNNTLISVIFSFTFFGSFFKSDSLRRQRKQVSERIFLVSLFHAQEVDRFDNSASNSLIDFIYKFSSSSSRATAFKFTVLLYLQGEFPYSSQTATEPAEYNRVKFHTIILITSRYSSGMQQVAEAGSEAFDRTAREREIKQAKAFHVGCE